MKGSEFPKASGALGAGVAAPRDISRRDFIQTTGGLVAAGALPFHIRMSPPRSGRLNILLLMDDQHRGDCLGTAGNPAIHTPHFDRLAEGGVRFAHAYTSAPSCTPARAGLLTGMSPWGHGMLGYNRIAERYPIEMPRLLAEAGYRTVTIGKNHFYPNRNGHGYGTMLIDDQDIAYTEDFVSDYNRWFAEVAPGKDPNATGLTWNDYRARPYALPERLHPTRWTGDQAVQFLQAYTGDRPFFLKVSFVRPHSPYDPPARFMDPYLQADLPRAQVGEWAEERFGSFTDGSNPDLARGNLGDEVVHHSRAGYYGNITFIDEQVGRILDVLEQRGFLDNTLILYISDHGDMTGDQYLWRKTYPYEPSAHVPMIVRWPDSLIEAERGRVLDQVVELRDVLPTFLDAADAPIPQGVEGESVVKLIRDAHAPWRPYLDLEHSTTYFPENYWNALTDGVWKYIFNAHDGSQQLFNIQRDPHELTDLASDPAHAADVTLWRERMIEHLAPRGPRWVDNGDLVVRHETIVLGPNYPGD